MTMFQIRYPWYDAPRFSTLREMVEAQADKHPDVVAFEFRTAAGVARKTYGEFRNEAASLAAAWGERGLSGAHVAILGGNSYEWILAFFAAACGGAVAVPLNHKLTKEVLREHIAHSDADMIVFDDDMRDVAEASGLKHLAPMSEIPALVRNGRSGFAQCAPKPEDAALIMYTSGTTGGNKGVLLTHELVMRNAHALGRSISFGGRNMVAPPLSFSGGILFGTVAPMAQGATVVVNREPMEVFDDLLLFRPVVAAMVPMMVAGIAKRIFSMSNEDAKRALGGRLEAICSGGAAVDPDLFRLYAGIGVRILPLYGMTEVGGVVVCLRDKQADRRGSTGMPLADVPVRIDNPDGSGCGEVLIHRRYAMKEYYKNPAATESVLRGDWLHTGDMGRFDEDGYLFITGRIKNLIILSNGENISPEELESKLVQSGYVSECMVHADGDMIAATIYPGEEYLDGKKYSREELLKLLYAEVDAMNARQALSRHIGKIILADKPLPKAAIGKIKRL